MTAEPLTDLELHALRHCVQVDMAPQEILHLSDVQLSARLLANLDQATAQVLSRWTNWLTSMTASAVKEAEQMDKLAADLEACRQQARAHLAAGEKVKADLEKYKPMPALLLEARDALPAISQASARLHNVRLDLADRIEAALEPWRVP
jgi:hypothetical protein